MGRYTGASCRLCRRQGDKLFLKGTRCQTDKCGVTKRPFAPGQHGKIRKKETDYGIQVNEKQKVKRMYGVLERQFRNYFKMAQRSKEVTGTILLQCLERRFDNVIFKLCFALSRSQARQMVKHSLFLVNGKSMNIPSYLVKAGDKIEVKAKEKSRKPVKDNIETLGDRAIPTWLTRDKENIKAEVISLPTRKDIDFTVNENLIVELYSK